MDLYKVRDHSKQDVTTPLFHHCKLSLACHDQRIGSLAKPDLCSFYQPTLSPVVPLAQRGRFMQIRAIEDLVLDIMLVEDNLYLRGETIIASQRAFKDD